MSQNVKAIPEGFHTLTPGLVVRDGHRAIELYKKAFGAEEIFRMPGMSSSPEALKGTTQAVYMYVQNVDAVFNQAVAAGAAW
jgi:PhnB protein